MAKDWRTLKLEVLAETTQFVKGMDKANATTQSFGDKVGDFAKKAGIALAAVGAAAGAMAIKVGKEAVAAASDLAETVSKVNVIFGQSAKNIEEFASRAAASLGQTRTQAMNAAATFGIFGKSAGLAGQELTAFSTEFVTLASDLASFNNTSVDQAITALGAALRGESEPIRSYGVLLNDATLKAKAMEMGIYSGTGTLSAQQKVLAAHKVILEQTRDAQGDFARTADGMANSQRILTARLEEAKIVLGQALLPIALDVVNLFNDRFLPVIEKLAGSFGGANGLIQQTQTFINQAREALAPILEALQRAFDRISESMEHNKDDINQNQFDALVSFCYNVGAGSLKKSTLLKKVNADPNDWSGVNYNYNRMSRGVVQYETILDDTITIQSDWITEAESAWLEQLVTSPDVYIYEGANLVSINITDSSYSTKYVASEQLFNLSVTFQYSQNRKRQRR